MSSTDRIEKQIELRAPRSRVWRALTNATELGAWFGVALQGEIAAGATVRGRITHPKYSHLTLEMTVEELTPETLFSYRWNPYAVDAAVDYSREPKTLVELRLADAPGGTLLTVTESGFDRVPVSRRELAFRMNSDGWAQQLGNIERHVAQG